MDLHEKGLIEKLLDTQCFDGQAAASLARNPHHVEISTNVYANPGSKAASCDQLDIGYSQRAGNRRRFQR